MQEVIGLTESRYPKTGLCNVIGWIKISGPPERFSERRSGVREHDSLLVGLAARGARWQVSRLVVEMCDWRFFFTSRTLNPLQVSPRPPQGPKYRGP